MPPLEPASAVLTPAQRAAAEERLARRMRAEVPKEQQRWKLRRLLMEGAEDREAPTAHSKMADRVARRAKTPCVWSGKLVLPPPEGKSPPKPEPNAPRRVKGRVVCGDGCAATFGSYRAAPGEGSF